MRNQIKGEQSKIIMSDAQTWNKWREENTEIVPQFKGAILTDVDFSGKILKDADFTRAVLRKANFREADLSEANFTRADCTNADFTNAKLAKTNLTRANLHRASLYGANLEKANLTRATLTGVDFKNANLVGANLDRAELSQVDLSGIDLRETNFKNAILNNTNLSKSNLSFANFEGTDLNGTSFSEAELMGANFRFACLIQTDLRNANLKNCHIYGIAAWKLNLEGAVQENLIVSGEGEPIITVDNIEVAQFVYLLLHNKKIRAVIDTVANKAVLILGRFTPERKAVLDAIRNELREHDYLPILFDFERPTDKNYTETIKTLAGLSKFIIADISEPSSVPLEMQAIIPGYAIPVVPLIREEEEPFSMIVDLQNTYNWVLDIVRYKNIENLKNKFKNDILKEAEKKHNEIRYKKMIEVKKK